MLPAVTALNVISIATFDIMPTFVQGTRQTLHFTEREALLFSALFMGGNVVGSMLTKYWVRGVSWPRAAAAALAGIVICDGLGAACTAPTGFLLSQVAAGISAGSLYSLTLTILSDQHNPDRHFGLLISAQVAFQALGLYAGPYLLEAGGLHAVLIGVTTISAVGFALLRFLPESGRGTEPLVSFRKLMRPATMFAFAGCFAFFLNAGSYWAFIELLGHDRGFSEPEIARSLVAGVVAGFVGALIASWIGQRWSRLGMIGLGTAMVLGAVCVLTGQVTIPMFLLSNCLFNFSWNFSVAYQYALVNATDRTGYAIALTPAFHTAGATAGPAIAALLIRPHDYAGVLWLVGLGVFASFLLFGVATLESRRRVLS